MRAREFPLEQRVGFVAKPRILQHLRRAADHGLSRVRVRGFAIGARGLLAYGLQQSVGQRRLGRVEFGKRHLGIDHRQAIGGRQRSVGNKPVERSIPRGDDARALGRFRKRHQIRDLAWVVNQQVKIIAGELRVRKDRHELRRRGPVIAGLGVLCLRRGYERLQLEPRGGFRLIGGTRLRHALQRRCQFLLVQQLLFVRFPRVIRKHPPILGSQLRAVVRQRRGQRLLDWPRAIHAQGEHPHVLLGFDLSGQPCDLGAIGLEQDHGRVPAHLEARAESLRARAVAVDVHGNEKA